MTRGRPPPAVRDGSRRAPRRAGGTTTRTEDKTRLCALPRKKNVSHNTSNRKGSPKRRGGVGLKQVGVHKRTFKPNLVKKTLWVDGKPQKVWISAKALRQMDPTLLVNPNK